MRKIFIVTNSCWNIINFRKDLINQLLTKNFTIIVSCPNDKHKDKLDLEKYKYLPIQYKRDSLNIFQNLKIILFYLIKIINEKPSTLLLFTIKPNIFVSLSALLSFKKIKVYNFITGIGNLYFETFFKKKIIFFLYRIAFLKSTKVIFQNLDDLNYFVSNNIISKQKTILIPGSGIDINKFNFSPIKKINPSNFNFLSVSRIIKHKGIEEFLNAAQLIKKEYPNVSFTLVGPIDYEYSAQISKITIDKIKSTMKHIDFSENIVELINKCDCFVLASYREGTSRSLLEAASIGKPIVTTDVPGCNNIVINNYNGYLCKPMNGISLYENLKKMINTEFEERNKMSINGRKRIEQIFDLKIINNKIINIIE